jgi:MFS family permease
VDGGDCETTLAAFAKEFYDRVIPGICSAFDGPAMLPLIAPDALPELGNLKPGTPEFGHWRAILFYVPAFAGGIFGLLGGYLTDRLGRRRVLTWSILIYAFSAFAAGFSTNLWMLLFFRCFVFVGVCVEFVAAIAWLAELFPDHEQRERVLAYTQFFSSLGGFLVATANDICVDWSAGNSADILFNLVQLPAVQLPAIQIPSWLSFLGEIKQAGTHAAWRYTLMSGLIPAIPLILIRPFLPESPAWRQKRETGTLRRPSLAALFEPKLRRVTIVTTLMFMCSYGAAFGAIQLIPEIAPGLPEVQAKVTKVGGPNLSKEDRGKLSRKLGRETAAEVTQVQEFGGLAGRFLFALLTLYIVSRRKLIRIFLFPGTIAMPLVFGWAVFQNQWAMAIGAFIAGLFTVAQFSFWGNYLPRVYPLHLRGTGEGFAANIGGRLLGTLFAALSSYLMTTEFMPGKTPWEKAAYTAAIVGASVFAMNYLLSFWLPEPTTEDLHD